MATYLVEAHVTKLDGARIRDLAARTRSAAEAMAHHGFPVRYLHSIFVPEDELCFHLLEAPSAEAVRRASERVDFAYERIVRAVETRSERSGDMAQYMVERHLAGFPPERLPAAAAAAKQKAEEIAGEGVDVRYVRSTYVPGTERCYCLFEGSSSEAVAEVQRRAELPYETIEEAAFLTAEDV
jgi:hypothetical protein